jgi:multidrug efflux system membrane fusion protein
VKLGALQEGLRVVEAGLASGERIVVNGLQRIRPGDPVEAKTVPADGKGQVADASRAGRGQAVTDKKSAS